MTLFIGLQHTQWTVTGKTLLRLAWKRTVCFILPPPLRVLASPHRGSSEVFQWKAWEERQLHAGGAMNLPVTTYTSALRLAASLLQGHKPVAMDLAGFKRGRCNWVVNARWLILVRRGVYAIPARDRRGKFSCTLYLQQFVFWTDFFKTMSELKFSCKSILFSNLLDQIREKHNSGKVSFQQNQQNTGMF